MKKILLLLLICFYFTPLSAQSISQRIKARAQQKANSKIDRTIDKTLDKTEKSVDSAFVKKSKEKNQRIGANEQNNDGGNNAPGKIVGKTNQVKNSSDFVPGEKIIFEDNFDADAINDFPARWNTNGGGSVVNIESVAGKWLNIIHNSVVNPVINSPLPSNCTIEFDLFLHAEGERSTPFIQFGITSVRDILKEDLFYKDRFFFNVHRYTEENGKTIEYGLKNDVLGNKSDFPITAYVNKILHIQMAINNPRIRIYLDGKKLIDLPRALSAGMLNNFFINNNYVIPASELGVFISNIRIADAAIDARSLLIDQLMKEGKTSTTDILFDTNSDVIKQESFSVINQFGEALIKAPSFKIKIVGHTDSDGSGASNLILSKNRAAAVKTYITENFAVAGSRIQTDGQGATQPVGPNTSAAGKAKNRRVEFIKL